MYLNLFSDSPLSLADPQSGDTGLLRYRLGDQPVTEGGCEIEIERSDDDSSSDSDTTDSNDVSTYSKTCLKRPLKKKTKIGFQD